MADTKTNQYIKRIDSDFVTPFGIGVIDIPSIVDTVIPYDDTFFFIYRLRPKDITVTSPLGKETVISSSGGTYTAQASGMYVIRYRGEIERSGSGTDPMISQFTVAFYITAVPNHDPLPLWNIKTVIDRVCDLIIPHKESEPPFYKLDPAQADEFEKILAPEFAFTQLTFKEILDQIGGFIHGVPRLIKGESGKFDTIHYDMLGGTEVAHYIYDFELCCFLPRAI